ncbi:MAG: hypothetical protein ABI597_03405 [Gammaproteobacteria bacterium]
MKALVATVNYLLLVDLQTGAVNIIESDRPEYYGISWWENSDSLVLSHSGLANDSLFDLESYVTSEKGYLSFDNKKTQCFLSQPHQIICAPNNWVIATNTGRNCVTLYDPSNDFYKDIRVNDIHWDRLGKENSCGEHFNSVYLKNNRLYVMAHRFKKTSHILEFSYPDCTLLERYETKQRSGLHNLWVDDSGNIIACHSEAGELIEVKSNETIWATGLFHNTRYSRGLAATTDIIIVGDSEVTTREGRKNSPSVLWIVDRKTLNAIDYMQLGSYGSVHEVRILDVADDAHHGKIFKGMANLEKKREEHQERLEQNRKQKLEYSREWQTNHHVFKDFTCILNGWTAKKNGWVGPKNESFTLSTAKESLDDNFTISLNYFFPKSDILSSQHLGLIVGYRGIDDTNMIAIMLEHATGRNDATLSLMINEKGIWKSKGTLLTSVRKKGKLSVSRSGDQLTIICNRSLPIVKKFRLEELDGAVGVRCLGSLFKNLSVGNNSSDYANNRIRKKVKAICQKLGVI